MTDALLRCPVMDRLRSLACRAIDAACWPIGKTAQRLIDWSAAQRNPTPAPLPFPIDYRHAADMHDLAEQMTRDGFGAQPGVYVTPNGIVNDAQLDQLLADLRKRRDGLR